MNTDDISPKNCTIIGVDVPTPEEDCVTRIGSGDVYLELLPDNTARIVGAEGDEAVQAVLEGVTTVLQYAASVRGAK